MYNKKELETRKLLVIAIMFIVIIAILTGESLSFIETSKQLEFKEDYKKWEALPDEEKTNYIQPLPTSIDLNKEDMKNLMNSKLKANIPNSYFLGNNIELIVRNQQATNSCWAFATTNLISTNLQKMGIKNSYVPLSTRHMDYTTSQSFYDRANPKGYNRSVSNGGNTFLGLSYCTAGYGPILESDMPFQNNEYTIALNQIENKNVMTKVEDYKIFPSIYKKLVNNNVVYYNGYGTDSVNYTEYTQEEINAFRQEVKQHIMNYGALTTQTYINGLYFFEAAGDKVYYCYDEFENMIANHAVTIVGWDDTYAKENFAIPAKHDGAYIVLNSWGQDWGDNGYYYISYDDVYVENVLFGVVKTDNIDYDNIYQYDPLGNVTNLNYDNDYIYSANVFTANKKENNIECLKEISIATTEEMDVEVYVNLNDDSMDISNLTKVATVANVQPGYKTISFDTALEITGEKFVVAIKTTQATVPLELNYNSNGYGSNFWDNATADFGQSYISFDGIDWQDLTEVFSDTNVCIKAFTTYEKVKITELIYSYDYYWRTQYNEGEIFSPENSKLMAIYSDGSYKEINISDCTFSINRPLTVEDTVITISYTEDNITKSTEINIEVYPIAVDIAEGNGTEENPYLISTPEELNKIRENPLLHYKLKNDIDMTEITGEGGSLYNNGKGWEKIGSWNYAFKGSLDGNNFEIKGLFANRNNDGEDSFGSLIANAKDATIKNLTIKSANLSGMYVAGFVFCASNCNLDNLRIENSTLTASYFAGGVVGSVEDNTTINRCSNKNGTVSSIYNIGEQDNGGPSVGGIIGETLGEITITNCYNTSTVSGGYYTGGIIGNTAAERNIENVYNIGNVTSNGTYGGIIGKLSSSTLKNCYDILNDTHIIGRQEDFINWENEEIIPSTITNTVEKTLEELKQQSTFIGFDFENIWQIRQNETPTFKTEIKDDEEILYGDVNGDKIVNGTDITYLGKYLNGLQGYTVREEIADVNKDGVIDWNDYNVLKKHLAGEIGYEDLPKAYPCGDTNRDYIVNVSDIGYLGKCLNGTYTAVIKVSDVNNDGEVDWKDYSILKKHIAGETGYETLPKKYTCGDINRDYLINASDIAYLGRYLNGNINYPIITKIADVNNDGEVDWKDYSILKKHIAGETEYETLPKEYTCGDINRDYLVNITDITYLGRHLNGNINYPVITRIADVNNDGEVDWKDYSILKKHIAGEIGYEELPKEYVCGDINRDYLVNSTDITYLGRYLNGIEGYEVIKKLADVNKDGEVDWADYKELKIRVNNTEN